MSDRFLFFRQNCGALLCLAKNNRAAAPGCANCAPGCAVCAFFDAGDIVFVALFEHKARDVSRVRQLRALRFLN